MFQQKADEVCFVSKVDCRLKKASIAVDGCAAYLANVFFFFKKSLIFLAGNLQVWLGWDPRLLEATSKPAGSDLSSFNDKIIANVLSFSHDNDIVSFNVSNASR